MEAALETAQACGIGAGDFWRLTPYELRIRARGLARAQRWRSDLALIEAWFTAGMGRMRQMPALDKLLGRPAAPPARTPEEEFAAIERMLGLDPKPLGKPKGKGTDAPASAHGDDQWEG